MQPVLIVTTKGQRMLNEGGGQAEAESAGKEGLVNARA